MPLAPTVPLPHGATMPQLGLGTWPMSSAEAERAVPTAIEAGYRLVDTAYAYGNEDGVGEGLRASRHPARGAVRHDEAQRGVARRARGPRGVRRQHPQARRRVPRPVPHPLAQSRPGPLRRRLARALPTCSTRGSSARSASRTSSPPTSSGSWSRPASRPTSTRSSSTPTSPGRSRARSTRGTGS